MKEIEVLLVEDNQGDVLLTREAFISWKVKNNIITLNDGEEALRYLNREQPYNGVVMPDLIILDINLPKVDGKEVLKFIKSSDELKHLPVVIFTSSCYEGDLQEIADSKADHYIQKPVELSSYFDAIRSIQNFWMNSLKSGTNEK
ncbi:response regulator [Lacibacter sediminis]|uniref:Response regulator n=1 Tax=Lacibacter sediminis TaxID=2760713 RepID=A0A7G5XIH8_9BACT|nr:response regulator [Lacibacter sediminis]QNA45281.1 response regulator [Lacibacter sediminis]